MLPATTPAPDLASFTDMAEQSMRHLPQWVRTQCASVVLKVEDAAEPEVLDELGITDPLDLTGLYQGTPLTERSVSDTPFVPDCVTLYRLAILDEWQERQDVPLNALITHVLVHELAHHFGYSDDDIARIDEWWL